MNRNRTYVPALVLLGLALQPLSAAAAMEIYHNTNASSSTSGEATVDGAQSGTTPSTHVINVATSHSAVGAHGRWVPGALESGVTLDAHSDVIANSSGQASDFVYVRAFDLVFTSSDPQATQTTARMRAHVTWAIQLPQINCGDLADCNIEFQASLGGAGSDAGVDGQMGSAACIDAFCGQPASGSMDFVTPTFLVFLNSPYYPTMQLTTMERVGLCAADFTTKAVGEISMNFADPVFDLPPGVTANSADLGIVNNHWIGTPFDPAGVGSGVNAGLKVARLTGLGTQPAVGRMTFTLQMPRPGRAALEIVRADGHLVSRIEEREYPAGKSQIAWDGRSLTGEHAPSGVYFVRLIADGMRADAHKVVLLR